MFRNRTSGICRHAVYENIFERLIVPYAIVALFIAPLFIWLAYDTNIPESYLTIAASFAFLLPIYILLCAFIKVLNRRLIIFLYAHLFGTTLYAYIQLYSSGFDGDEFVMFFAYYALCIILIQRLYAVIIYNGMILALLVHGSQSSGELFPDQEFVYALFTVFSLVSIIVCHSKRTLTDSVDKYVNYLREIINNPGWGYFLFECKVDRITVIDYNQKAVCELGVENPTDVKMGERFTSFLTREEKVEIYRLKTGKSYRKNIQYYRHNELQHIEIEVILINYRKETYWLARIGNVTDEIKKREQLEVNERKYRNLYNQNKAGVFTLDKKSTIINGNTAFWEMFEGTVNVGENLFSGDQLKEWSFIQELLESKENIQSYQTQVTLHNGNEKIFIFNWYFDQQTQNIEGSVIDSTNIQRTSQALKQSEKKYRSIFEESYDAILVLDKDVIVDVNRRAVQLFGISEEELLNEPLFKLSIDTSDRNRKRYDDHFEKLANLRSTKFDWLFNSNGYVVEAEVSLVEIILEEKLFYQCVIHDRTDLNKNLREVERNQRNLERILESNPEGILIASGPEVMYMNPEMKRLMGDSLQLQDLFVEDDQKRFQDLYDAQNKSKTQQNTSLELMSKDGELLLVDVTMVPTIYEDVESTLIIIKDISVQNVLAKQQLRAEIAEETNKKLADEIVDRIHAEKQLQDQFLRTRAILDSSSNTFLLTLTKDMLISTYNTHFHWYCKRIFQISVEEKNHFYDLFSEMLSDVQIRLFRRMFTYILKGGSRQMEVQIGDKELDIWMEIFMSPIFDTEGVISEISIVAHDISEKKKTSIEIEESLKEKEVLLKEIHHRVKNNLQVISSILNLQSSFITDENTLGILQESRNRIRSMAIIHENLYRTEDFSSVNFAEYLKNLTANLVATYRIHDQVLLHSDLENIDLVLDQAIPCGLLVNELITNALKYAWDEGETGSIVVELKQEGKYVHLMIADDGRGLPMAYEDMNSDTLGLQLVATLTEQLDGEVKVEVKKGTKYLIKFENIKPLVHVKD